MPEYRNVFVNNGTEAGVKELWLSFVLYAGAGLLFEALFSGVFIQVERVLRGEKIDWDLPCKTYLWSILVYGLSAAVSFTLAYRCLGGFFDLHWALRGATYVLGIYLWEYFWGFLIETLTGKCPWRYRDTPRRIWRYVSPLFVPVWFGVGLMMEALYETVLPLLGRLPWLS